MILREHKHGGNRQDFEGAQAWWGASPGCSAAKYKAFMAKVHSLSVLLLCTIYDDVFEHFSGVSLICVILIWNKVPINQGFIQGGGNPTPLGIPPPPPSIKSVFCSKKEHSSFPVFQKC